VSALYRVRETVWQRVRERERQSEAERQND
jgi:hypothetical protein